MFLAFIQSVFSQHTAQALCRTLIHSLWQGIFAAVVAGLILFLTKQSSVQFRYRLLCFVFFGFFCICVFTFVHELQTISSPAFQAAISEGVTIMKNDESSIAKGFSLTTFITRFTQQYTNILLPLWIVAFLYKCSRLTVGFQQLSWLRTRNVKKPAQNWINKLDRLKQKMLLKVSVQLMESSFVKVPVAIGLLKPLILLPIGLLSNLSPAQVETILLHELAHIKRKDYLVNLFQNIVETIFFFNPAFLWISALIQEEREACCDDMVIVHTTDKMNYVNALISFHEYALSNPFLAMGIGGRKMFLLNRIKRLMTGGNKQPNGTEKILLLLGLMVLSAFTLLPLRQAKSNKVVPAKVTGSLQSSELSQKKRTMISLMNGLDTFPSKAATPKQVMKQQTGNIAKSFPRSIHNSLPTMMRQINIRPIINATVVSPIDVKPITIASSVNAKPMPVSSKENIPPQKIIAKVKDLKIKSVIPPKQTSFALNQKLDLHYQLKFQINDADIKNKIINAKTNVQSKMEFQMDQLFELETEPGFENDSRIRTEAKPVSPEKPAKPQKPTPPPTPKIIDEHTELMKASQDFEYTMGQYKERMKEKAMRIKERSERISMQVNEQCLKRRGRMQANEDNTDDESNSFQNKVRMVQ